MVCDSCLLVLGFAAGYVNQQAGGERAARVCGRDGVRGAVKVHDQGWTAGQPNHNATTC